MEIFENQEYRNLTMVLDDKSFIGCTFENCTLIYHGGDAPWANTTFKNCNIALQGAAARTAQALQLFGWKPGEAWNQSSAKQPESSVVN